MISPSHGVAPAYDMLAGEYEAQLEQNPVAVYMRKELHTHFGRVFRAGDRVLDFTAGTGLDALYLAARGVRVTALDASSGMIAQLREAASRAGLDVKAQVLNAEHLSELGISDFDGAISTFGGLNTIDNLTQLARDLHSCLKPGGRLILHALNQFCFWEWARRPSRRRRVREIALGTLRVPHRFYNPFELWQSAFISFFELRTVYSLSVLAAPSLVRRIPRAARLIFAVDRIAGRAFPAAGDFFVMELVRRNE